MFYLIKNKEERVSGWGDFWEWHTSTRMKTLTTTDNVDDYLSYFADALADTMCCCSSSNSPLSSARIVILIFIWQLLISVIIKLSVLCLFLLLRHLLSRKIPPPTDSFQLIFVACSHSFDNFRVFFCLPEQPAFWRYTFSWQLYSVSYGV